MHVDTSGTIYALELVLNIASYEQIFGPTPASGLFLRFGLNREHKEICADRRKRPSQHSAHGREWNRRRAGNEFHRYQACGGAEALFLHSKTLFKTAT